MMLKIHMDEKHYRLEDNGTFPCSICGKIFDALKNLQVHEKSHKEEIGSFSCEHCDFKTYKETLVRAHIR